MSDDVQTPFPTASSRSQAFVLKTTRPNGPDGPLSPVPEGGNAKPVVKRVYTRRKTIHSSGSRNLKENASHSRNPGPTLEDGLFNLRTKLRARRTTSFANLKDRQRESTLKRGRRSFDRLVKSSSQVSLASPFSSQPSSPSKAPALLGSNAGQNSSKRTLIDACNTDDAYHPLSKRRQSKAPNTGTSAPKQARPLPSPISVRPKLQNELLRRPSHPTLGLELLGRDDDLKFDVQSALASVNFNRPPSHLSIYAPIGGDDDDWPLRQTGPMIRASSWAYNDRFEAELICASTPYNPNRVARGASPSPDFMPTGLLASPDIKSEASITRRGSLGDLTQNMSLTSMGGGTIHEAELSANRSPWITDSLISPPTIYVRRADENEVAAQLLAQQSTTLSESDVDVLGGLEDVFTNEAPGVKMGYTAVPEESEKCDPPAIRLSLGRTRSGTILAPAGRTRTGTITAPPTLAFKKQNRARSGTITPSSQAQAPLLDPVVLVPSTLGRARSGTIIAPQKLKAPVPEPVAAETHEVVGVDMHIDAKYDPTPDLELAFSPAPNPDLDVEGESEDEGVVVAAPKSYIALSPSSGTHKGAKRLLQLLSPQTDPLNLDSPNAFPARSTMKPESKRFKRQSLKAVLGLNLRGHSPPGSALGESSSGSALGRDVKDAPGSGNSSMTLSDNPFSSDPLDFLSHFDERGFNKPYEAALPPPKRKTRGKGASVRWDK